MQHGYLVLADISGYTSYLAGVELDHAHDVLTDLLETIVGSLKALLAIAKLEGDAVFGYVPESRVVRGETLVELEEAAYAAFRDRLEGIRRRTTCTCNACRAIPLLDLKFITHHGNYVVQNVSGITELVGSDVNLLHRLLKNHVAEATGWKAYALFTAATFEHLAVPCDPAVMHMQVEHYEHLGEVQTFSLNLRQRYQDQRAARRVIVTPKEAHVTIKLECPGPPPLVWDWLNDPQLRSRWMAGTQWTAGERPGGRTGAGAQNHCAHGKNETTTEVMLDWRPFEYFTSDSTSHAGTLRMTYLLEPVDSQCTRVITRARILPSARLPAWAAKLMCKLLVGPLGFGRQLRSLPAAMRAAASPAPAQGAPALP